MSLFWEDRTVRQVSKARRVRPPPSAPQPLWVLLHVVGGPRSLPQAGHCGSKRPPRGRVIPPLLSGREALPLLQRPQEIGEGLTRSAAPP